MGGSEPSIPGFSLHLKTTYDLPVEMGFKLVNCEFSSNANYTISTNIYIYIFLILYLYLAKKSCLYLWLDKIRF